MNMLTLDKMVLPTSYATPDPEALQELLTAEPQGNPEELGAPQSFPQEEMLPSGSPPEEQILDQQQLDSLAKLHLEELKAYVGASEQAQWKASDPATR